MFYNKTDIFLFLFVHTGSIFEFMNEITRIRIDSLCDIFAEYGVTATREQVELIEKDFSYHIDMEREMSNYQHSGGESFETKKLKERIKELERERDNVIMSFKKNVATRRGWDIQDVCIGENGEAFKL